MPKNFAALSIRGEGGLTSVLAILPVIGGGGGVKRNFLVEPEPPAPIRLCGLFVGCEVTSFESLRSCEVPSVVFVVCISLSHYISQSGVVFYLRGFENQLSINCTKLVK